MTALKEDTLKEEDKGCLEVLKSSIVEGKVLKTWRIDKHTFLHKLPEKVVNQFFDFLSSDAQYRHQMLFIIRSGLPVQSHVLEIRLAAEPAGHYKIH